MTWVKDEEPTLTAADMQRSSESALPHIPRDKQFRSCQLLLLVLPSICCNPFAIAVEISKGIRATGGSIDAPTTSSDSVTQVCHLTDAYLSLMPALLPAQRLACGCLPMFQSCHVHRLPFVTQLTITAS